jgi:hypothetical protein
MANKKHRSSPRHGDAYVDGSASKYETDGHGMGLALGIRKRRD